MLRQPPARDRPRIAGSWLRGLSWKTSRLLARSRPLRLRSPLPATGDRPTTQVATTPPFSRSFGLR
eukprot:8242611-Alexandrium_andersonii.AAC.1